MEMIFYYFNIESVQKKPLAHRIYEKHENTLLSKRFNNLNTLHLQTTLI